MSLGKCFMRIYLDQIGCRLNYSEMETLAKRLTAAGHHPVDAPEDAQVIVFNVSGHGLLDIRAYREKLGI